MDWDLASRIVISLGLPFSIFVFLYERRKEREADAVEVNEALSAAYTDFLKLVIQNPDLSLSSDRSTPGLNEEQRERMNAIFEILTSIFQRAYLLGFGRNLTGKRGKRWRAWEAYMRQWCRRDDYRARLAALLPIEDPDFARFIRRIAAEEEARAEQPPGPTGT
ncbi:hypothetical protein GI374_03595 [Paracoccus sp. S-4012]|uniref:hypothetical protein n=1 Tax=Paracoccus sp. S-4012 TaxID=2665648 RepID=UPI0012B08A68|nr:hypothetical protein [Paracoccus sp. S-4012]MRX49541.1 hypothetical protein [Paracoccus sp. S-4012]